MTSKGSRRRKVDMEPGDLIEIFRIGYQHWAVYVGSGYVVHLTRPSGQWFWDNTVEIKKEKLSNVAGKDRYCVNNKHDSKYPVRTPEEIISLANILDGNRMKYKVTSDNCEHFANYLRYKVPRSDQVFIWGFVIMIILLFLIVV